MTAVISGTNGLLQAYDYQVSTTGFSYTFAAGTQVLVINPAGTLATGTITMPASPSDGMTITFSSTKIITALTVNANTGQTINNAVTTLAAGQSASYVYRTASTAWFPYSDVSVVSGYAGPSSTQFTSSGTFTVPTGITKVKVTVVGGGGAGSGGGNGGGTGSPGGGGGGGGAAIKWLTGLVSGTLTVTVGAAGGTCSVASGTNNTITTFSATGGGGVGSSGDLNIGGASSVAPGSGQNGAGGNGGSSILGGGGAGGVVNSDGNAGKAYGGGGGGGGGGSTNNGGAGTTGVVIFEY
jgi:hypothetical protein